MRQRKMKTQIGSPPSLLNVREAAKRLGVSVHFLYVHRNTPSYRVGKALRFSADELREYFKSR